jgi:hypothetical protein
MSYAANAWNAVGKTPPYLPTGNLPEPTPAEPHRHVIDCEELGLVTIEEKVLTDLYAVRGGPPREHTLVFHGTPDEFAFFKTRMDEWAKKRISI